MYKEKEQPNVSNEEETIEESVGKETTESSKQEVQLLDEDFEYKLKGVVIHKGTAEWGHYVSLIQANTDSDEEKWLLLDDGHVTEFKTENFNDECFGGSNKEEYAHTLYDMGETFGGASKSAYILIYDKIKKSKLHFEFTDENINEKDFIIQNLINKKEYTFKDNVLETDFYNLGKYTPPRIQGIIKHDNNRFVLEQQLFNSNFLTFLSDVLLHSGIPIVLIDYLDGYYGIEKDIYDNNPLKLDNQGNIPALPELNSHQKILINIFSKVIPKYFFGLYCNSNELFKLQAVEKVLERVFILDPGKAWDFFNIYIKENLNRIFYFVISNTELIIRTSVAELVASCIQVLMKYYRVDLTRSEENMNQIEKYLKEFIDKYLALLNHMENSNSYKKLPQYFYLLYRCLQNNPNLIDYLIEKQFLNDLYEFYNSKEESKTYSKDAHEKALNFLLGTLTIILKRLKKKYFNDKKTGNFYRNLFFNLLDSQFFKKILKEDYLFSGFEFVKQFVYLACENNEIMTYNVISICLEGIIISGTNDILPYLESLKSLLMIRDKLHYNRIKAIFGIPRLDESKVKPESQMIYVFGLGKENNVTKSVYNFHNPILKQKGLIELIIQKHENFKEWVTVVSCFVMEMLTNNDQVLMHLLNQKSPHHFSGNCLDWLWIFAKEVEKGHNITYSIMRQEIQYFYLRKFKERVNDFIVFIRHKLGIAQTPELILFEDDWEIDCSHYLSNGQQFPLIEGSDPREISSPALKSLRKSFNNHLSMINVLKMRLSEQPNVDHIQEIQQRNETNILQDTGIATSTQEGKTIPRAPPLKSIQESTCTEELDQRERFVKFIDKVIFSSGTNKIIGKSLNRKRLKKIVLEFEEQTKLNDDYEDEIVINNLEITIDLQHVLSKMSLPLGKNGNLSIPNNCLHHESYLKGFTTMKDKAFAFFTRDGGDLQTSYQYEEDDVRPFFDEIDTSKGKNDFSNAGNDYKVEYPNDEEVKEVETGEKGEEGEGQPKQNEESLPNNDNLNNNKGNSLIEQALNINNSNIDNSESIIKSNFIPIYITKIVRIGVMNKTDSHYLIKLEFNKIEDIDFSGQILNRGYFEGNNKDELIWSDNDAYTEDETNDDENYIKNVIKNHRLSASKLFRKQKEIKRVKEILKKNYKAYDLVQGVTNRKRDTPLTYLEKRNEGEPFGHVVIRVSWIKVDKANIKALEKNISKEWNWKLIRICLPK